MKPTSWIGQDPTPRDAEGPQWPKNTRRRARSSHQAARRALTREAAAWTLVGPASLKRGLSEECEGFLWKILPRQRVATRQL